MIPETSTTLLKDISGDADNARWPEFVSRYRPMMCDYVKTHFPGLDADELVQQTLIALSNVLPRYRYAPDETGRFHNYLTGILRNKALKLCEKRSRELAMKAELQRGAVDPVASTAAEEAAAWREALLEIAMRQLLSDDRIPDKSKQIFQRVMVDGLAPEDVAAAYGTSRNNVDQTKRRMLERLRRIVRSLEEVGDV